MSLSGKVALITGGSKNLGAQIARELAGQGATLAIHYNSASSEPSAVKLAKELNGMGVQASIHVGDLTSAAACEKLFDDVVKEHGRVDILVNAVGMVLKKPITEITEAEYDKMFAINSKSAFFQLKEGAKHIQPGGRMVTIVTALISAFTGQYTAYAGAKACVDQFMRGCAKELADKHISVNNIAPGPLNTSFFFGQEAPEAVTYHKSNAMGNRLGEITDIAPVVRFLCTEGGWITGQTIFANGGYTTR